MDELTKAEFKGRLKTTTGSTTLADKLNGLATTDQVVIHGSTKKDQKIAYKVLRDNFEDLFSYIGGGIDGKTLSFSEILGNNTNTIENVQKIIGMARKEYDIFSSPTTTVTNPTIMGNLTPKKYSVNIKTNNSKPKYQLKKGPKLKNSNNNSTSNNNSISNSPNSNSSPTSVSGNPAISNPKTSGNPAKGNPKPTNNKPKQSKTNSNSTNNKPKPKLKAKSLSGLGSTAISIATTVAGIVAKTKDKDQKTVSQAISNSKYKQQNNNQYAMQIAKDISSYRYGKHMTGFINS